MLWSQNKSIHSVKVVGVEDATGEERAVINADGHSFLESLQHVCSECVRAAEIKLNVLLRASLSTVWLNASKNQ